MNDKEIDKITEDSLRLIKKIYANSFYKACGSKYFYTFDNEEINMANDKYREIHIMMGLPGSGKSHFVSHNFHDGYATINLDDWNEYDRMNRLQGFLMKDRWDYRQLFVIDGLILTKEDLKNIISYCDGSRIDNSTKFIIHYWNEDREACKNNDRYRVEYDNRKVNSRITIENAFYDYITEMDVRNILNECFPEKNPQIDVKYHYIHQVNETEAILNKHSIKGYDPSPFIDSESWSCGGTWCNCWGNEGEIEPDVVPQFEEFDNILVEICPNITFLQYKKLYNNCVTVENYDEHDYYGGTENRAFYRCNKQKLYEALQDMNLI